MAEKITQYLGTGRRKTSVARVRLIPGGQGVEINGKAMDEYFGANHLILANLLFGLVTYYTALCLTKKKKIHREKNFIASMVGY